MLITITSEGAESLHLTAFLAHLKHLHSTCKPQHHTGRIQLLCICRSFYHANVFDGGLDIFFDPLINSQPDGGLFDRFLIQCMLFQHAVLTCPSYKGTSSALEMSSAARSQVCTWARAL